MCVYIYTRDVNTCLLYQGVCKFSRTKARTLQRAVPAGRAAGSAMHGILGDLRNKEEDFSVSHGPKRPDSHKTQGSHIPALRPKTNGIEDCILPTGRGFT